jgi:hypothetical protein
VEFFDLDGHLAEGIGIAADGVEGDFVPELAGCVLQAFQVMRIICHFFFAVYNLAAAKVGLGRSFCNPAYAYVANYYDICGEIKK